MKIWRFYDTRDSAFACASWRGAWSESKGLCSQCNASTQRRIQPLILEWEPGADTIGDFTCTGICNGFVITERVYEELSARFRELKPNPVTMVQDSRLKKPTGRGGRRKPRVWLPYSGPPLVEMWVPMRVGMARQRTTAKLKRRCDACGFARYVLCGVENISSRYIKDRQDLATVHTPRAPDKGLFVRTTDLMGANIFRVSEFDGWVLCTDRVKSFIEEKGFTNISFLEMGDVV